MDASDVRRVGLITAAAIVLLLCPCLANVNAAPAHDDITTGDLLPTTVLRRDDVETIAAPVYKGTRPPKHSLSSIFPIPGDQGGHSTCAAWTAAYALRTYSFRVSTNAASVAFSPAFVHNQIATSYDQPASLEQALRTLRDVGALPTTELGLDENAFKQRTTRRLRKLASRYRIKGFYRLEILTPEKIIDGIKDAVLAGKPVAIAAAIDDHFRRVKERTVLSFVPDSPFWHAFVITGYDDDLKAFQIFNSYGPGWNDGGYGWIGYEVFVSVSPDDHYIIDG